MTLGRPPMPRWALLHSGIVDVLAPEGRNLTSATTEKYLIWSRGQCDNSFDTTFLLVILLLYQSANPPWLAVARHCPARRLAG